MKQQTLRFILYDQLNAQHSWFKKKDDDVLYVIAEIHQELQYVAHHIQKVCAFFAAMEAFSNALKEAGHRVLHLTLDDTKGYKGIGELLCALCDKYSITHLEYQRPDEYRLIKAFEAVSKACHVRQIICQVSDTEHFLLPFEELHHHVQAGRHNRMEAFYRRMRKRFNILMEDDQPLGGKWNYDHENRHAFKKSDVASIPEPLKFAHDVRPILKRLKSHNIRTIGNSSDRSLWPINRRESKKLLAFFCEHLLPKFGYFQDAMTKKSQHAWSLYHSRLSFSLNLKMLHPMQVINAALESFHQHPDRLSLAQVEGFIRQILGWREFVRGLYWVNAYQYHEQNFLNASHTLPHYFWDGKTNMSCMQVSIQQSLDYAYAHHIQRLMITGNFALLAGLNPDQVERWYLGIYIDAIEWVEQPNTRGMALFSDGGWVATKPYAASGNYIKKMSDYCTDCYYIVSKKTGDRACPFNSLYWHFIHRNSEKFVSNPRMLFPYKTWQKIPKAQQKAILDQGKAYLKNLDTL